MADQNDPKKPPKAKRKMSEWQKSQADAYREYIRTSAVGLEFGLSIAVGAVLGWLIDRYFHSSPWGLIIGLIIGSIAAGKRMYGFVKKYLEKNRDGDDKNK